jgi:putative transposase
MEARMPRRPRVHFPGAFYHVTLRGNHRQNIFFAPADRKLFESLTAEILERYAARLHAYCWMTNHVHMLVQVGDTPLGRLILQIAGRYARTIQRHLHTTGHLFENRHHAILVDADEYLLELLRYIHLNPVRARMVDHPDDYAWSSHHAYVGTETQPWVTTDFALAMLHAERERAVAAYRRFVDEGVAHPSPSPLLDCNNDDVLGADDFMSKLRCEPWRPKSKQSFAELIAEACARFSVTEPALRSNGAQRTLTRVRTWVAHEAVSRRIASLSHVARHFGRAESGLRCSVQRTFGRR